MELIRVGRASAAIVVALCLATLPSPVSPQAVEIQNDSLSLRFVDTDLRGAIQAIGRFLDKPILAGALGEVRVEVFETPTAVARTALPELLRALVEAHGLIFSEDSLFYRVSRPPPPEPQSQGPPTAADQSRGPLQLFTVRLQHAKAVDVAATLNQLYGAGPAFATPAGLSTGTLSDELRSDRERVGAGGGASTDQASQDASLQSPVTLVPDPTTNALLIRATEDDYQLLTQAIAQLDTRPPQVLIEVVVVEARRDRQFALGFDAAVPPQDVDGGTIEGSLFGAGLGDLVVRVMGLTRAEINATLVAARLRGDVDILSRPVLLASNNTEAHLLVGTQQPFVQVSRSLPTETPQRDQVVQYRDVGTKLTVLPTVNDDGYVSLLIQQEISAATGETQFNAPVISSRETVTQVLVANRQTIVIGGLRDEVRDRVRTGIPLLADIPLLGGLFGSTRTRSTETELFLFITPTIVLTDEDMASLTRLRVPERLMNADFLNIQPPVAQPPIQDLDELRDNP